MTTYGRRFRQLLVKRVAAERQKFANLNNSDISHITIVEMHQFPMNRWGDIGAVEVTYTPDRIARAIYGFDALGNVNIYMD